MNSIQDIWNMVLERMRSELYETTINTWFDEVNPVALEGDTLVLHCGNDFKRSTIEDRFLGNISASMKDIFSTDFTIRILSDAALQAYQQAEPVASGTGQMTQAQEEQWARFDLPHGLKRTDGTVLSLSDGTGSTGGSMAPQDGKEVCTRGGTFAQTIPVEEIAAFVVGGVEIPMP